MFTRKRITYGLVAIIIILTLVIPLYNYILGYYQGLQFWESHNIENYRSIFDVWDTILYDTGNIFLILMPITMILLASTSNNTDNKSRIKSYYLRVFKRPIGFVLLYSLIAMLIGLILPTKGIFNLDDYDSSTILINLFITHINFILFTIFVTCFYLISVHNIRNKSIATLVAVVSIIIVIYGMGIIGEILPLPDVEWLRSYHFIVHNLVMIDKNEIMVFEFLYILILALLLVGLTYLTLKYGDSEQDETF